MDATTDFLDASARIRDDILAGRLRAGERLKLAALARRYRLGQTPVREALRELAGERLVDIVPNCGASVRRFDRAAIANLFEIRMALEGLVARRAAERAERAAIDALRTVHVELAEHAEAGNYAAALDCNRRFHHAIGAASGNAEALDILERHWRILPGLWRSVGYAATRLPQVVADHLQILESIESRDADAASCLATAHVARARRELFAHMPDDTPRPNA